MDKTRAVILNSVTAALLAVLAPTFERLPERALPGLAPGASTTSAAAPQAVAHYRTAQAAIRMR